MAVDIESLRLIVQIDELGSLGAAARSLKISQPAASARLRSLESRHGLVLVTRSTRGSTLTDDGRAVCTWARDVLSELTQLEAGIDALSAQRRGDLKIAASLTIAEHLMPRWLGILQRNHPEVHAGLVVVNSTDVIRQVLAGTVDIGFVESPAIGPGLLSRWVGSDRVTVVVSPDHAWATESGPVTATELRITPLVVRETGSGTRETFDRALGATPRIAMEAGSTAAVIGAALAGVGPAIVSEIAVRHAIASGALIEVPVGLDLQRSLRAVWSAKGKLRVRAEDLVDIAAQSGPPRRG